MKRVLVVLLIMLVAYAGTASATILSVGLKAGVNLANIKDDPAPPNATFKIRPGLVIGGQAELGFPMSPLSVRGELLYTMKGSKVEFNNTDGTTKLDEFVFAPFLVYSLPTPVVKPFIEAGPEVGFVMTHKQTSGGVTTTINDYAKTNISLNVGAGLKMPVMAGIGSVDVRYNLGLSDMNTATGLNSGKTKTNGIQLMLGYAFSVL